MKIKEMKKILRKWKTTLSSILQRIPSSYIIFFVVLSFYGCEGLNTKLKDNLDKEIESAIEEAEAIRNDVEDQKGKMKELQEHWRILDSISNRVGENDSIGR